jgi:GNAT superfamily N-acetyltransferase
MSVEVRTCGSEADIATSTQIYNDTWPRDALTVAETQAFHERMDESEEWIALLDGAPAGSAVAAVGGPVPPENVFALITVVRDKRRRGVGTALYRAVSAWARERGRETLRTRAREDDPDGFDYALRHGFAEVGRDTDLELHLRGVEPPDVAPPEGVEIASLAERPEFERQVYDVAVECYPDIPGSEHYVFGAPQEWLRHHLHGPSQRQDANFVALAANEVVGYAKLSLTAARPASAFHGMTAVRRAWRGRGVAGALKRAQIRWALANGLERLETSNELRNEPMRRVNLALGYMPAPGTITLEGPLARLRD